MPSFCPAASANSVENICACLLYQNLHPHDSLTKSTSRPFGIDCLVLQLQVKMTALCFISRRHMPGYCSMKTAVGRHSTHQKTYTCPLIFIGISDIRTYLISGFDSSKKCEFTHPFVNNTSCVAVGCGIVAGCLQSRLLRGLLLFERANARHAPQHNELGDGGGDLRSYVLELRRVYNPRKDVRLDVFARVALGRRAYVAGGPLKTRHAAFPSSAAARPCCKDTQIWNYFPVLFLIKSAKSEPNP